MPDRRSFHVRVPATAANLGPGFDCIGIALDIWNEVDFSFSGKTGFTINVEGEGQNSLPVDESNLIFRVMKEVASASSKSLPDNISIHCENHIPVASGLGSSSAAVVAGVLAVRNIFDLDMNEADLINTAYAFEGHADNVAACVRGGLTLALETADGFITEKIPVFPIKVVIAVPDYNLSTRDARKALPSKVSMQNAVFNIGHASLLSYVLHSGKFTLLQTAMQDRIHQDYRLELIPGAREALSAAIDSGAAGTALAGAGPSVLAFANTSLDKIGASMQAAFANKGISSSVLITEKTDHGANID